MSEKAVSKLKERFQNQLLDLKKRQRKYELIVQVAEYLAELPEKEESYPDVAEEVAATFSAFATKFLDKIEASEEAPKDLKPEVKQNTTDNPKPEKVEDKLQFLLQYRHLENKLVNGFTDTGEQIEGHVKGIDAPYLIVFNKDSQKQFKIKPGTIQGA